MCSRLRLTLLFVLVAIAAAVASSGAGVPAMMTYQGKMTDAAGQPVSDGSYNMRFALYDQQSGGTLLWQEPLTADPPVSVQVVGGVFTVLLGSTVPLVETAFQGNTWLQTQVNGEVLAPRVRIVSSGYSFLSENLSLPFSGTVSAVDAGLSITNTGSGSAGSFKLQGAGNYNPALEAVSVGPGPALKATNNSSGLAGQFDGNVRVSNIAAIGAFRMSSSAGAGKVLTSDVYGNGTWQNLVGVTSAYTNVKDYGAKGDGVTDDTAAIQAAMNAASTRSRSEPFPGGGTYINSNAAVFFPSGRYNVTDTITIKADMIGEGQAILYQSDSSKDIVSGQVWRISIFNMGFAGGKNHLVFGTSNVDSSRILIQQCQFNRAADCAVRILPGSNSTMVEIDDSTFIHCNQVFVNWCDVSRLANCWISSLDTMTNQAVLENHGNLLAENICGVPWPVDANNQRWIDNYGNVTCRKFRFGGEGAGFTAVVNWAAYAWEYPVIPSSVVLDDCDIYAVCPLSRRCAIYCEEIPNQIIVTNCRGFIDIVAVKIRSTINLNTYFDNAETWCYDSLRYQVDESNSFPYTYMSSGADLPEQMRPHQVGQVGADAKPTTGRWREGTFVRNRQCRGTGTPLGWMCVTSGEPGTWHAVNVTFAP